MSTLLSIDPGIRGCGVGVFVDDSLRACAYVKNPEKTGAGPLHCATMARAVVDWLWKDATTILPIVDKLALEWPQTYSGRAAKGDANDLFPLAGVDAALAALFPKAGVTHYLPMQWKGTLEKSVMGNRIRGRLSAEESMVLAKGIEKLAPSLVHNVLDGIGVGLKYLGRLDRVRTFARE